MLTQAFFSWTLTGFIVGHLTSTSWSAGVTTTTPRSNDPNGFHLDMDELQRMGITPEDVIQHIRLLVDGNYVCTGNHHRPNSEDEDMPRYFIRNRTVTCNDGSPPG